MNKTEHKYAGMSGEALMSEARSLRERLLGYDQGALAEMQKLRDWLIELVVAGECDGNTCAALGDANAALVPFERTSFSKEVMQTKYFLQRRRTAMLQALEGADPARETATDVLLDGLVPDLWALWGLELRYNELPDSLVDRLTEQELDYLRSAMEITLSNAKDDARADALQCKWNEELPWDEADRRRRARSAR